MLTYETVYLGGPNNQPNHIIMECTLYSADNRIRLIFSTLESSDFQTEAAPTELFNIPDSVPGHEFLDFLLVNISHNYSIHSANHIARFTLRPTHNNKT